MGNGSGTRGVDEITPLTKSFLTLPQDEIFQAPSEKSMSSMVFSGTRFRSSGQARQMPRHCGILVAVIHPNFGVFLLGRLQLLPGFFLEE
jgi:hypothetical protein